MAVPRVRAEAPTGQWMSFRQLTYKLKADHGFSADAAEAAARTHFENGGARTNAKGRVEVWVQVQVVDGWRLVVQLPLQ